MFSAKYVRSMTKQSNGMAQCFSKNKLPSHSLTEQECCKLITSLSLGVCLKVSLLKKLGTDISAHLPVWNLSPIQPLLWRNFSQA